MFCTFWHFYTPEKKRNLLCCLLLLMLSNRGCSSWFWNLSWTVRERNGLFLFWLKKANILMNHTSVLWDLIYSEQIKCTEEALHCVQKERPFSLCTCKLSRVTLQRFDVWKIVQWMLLLFFCRWRPERRSWRSQTKSNLLLVRSRFHFKDIVNFLSEILTYFNIQPVEDTEKKLLTWNLELLISFFQVEKLF